MSKPLPGAPFRWLGHMGWFLLFVAIGAGSGFGLQALVAGSGNHPSHGNHGQVGPGQPAPNAGAQLLIDLRNRRCPITGDEVDGQSFVTWKGLKIGLCCPACGPKLLAAPEIRLDAAGIAWREAAGAASSLACAGPDARTRVLEKIRKRFAVVSR